MAETKFTSSERLSFIRVGRAMGLTYSQIASSLGVSRQRVHQICQIYNISKGEQNNGKL